MPTLQHRLGTTGPARERALLAIAEAARCYRRGSSALDDVDVGSLRETAESYDFPGAAALFPSRASGDGLMDTAWFGARLASLTSGARSRDGQRMGALFNIAVALFDTIVDEHPQQLPELVRCISLRTLQAALFDGRPLPPSADVRVARVSALLDEVFRELRCARLGERRQVLWTLLREMYRGELGYGDAGAAKLLPTLFIGCIGSANWPVLDQLFFLEVARFVALWDDWADLGADLRAGRENTLLGRAGWQRAPIARLAWSMFRLGGGRVSHEEISLRLAHATHALLRAAAAVGDATVERTLGLLGELVGWTEWRRA